MTTHNAKSIILLLIAIILFLIATLSLLGFFAVVTPEEALNRGYPPMPENWEAGIFSHGSYYKWFTIAEHPILFGFSILLFFAAWGVTIVTILSQRKAFLIKHKSD